MSNQIPNWIKNVLPEDNILLYFPYTSNSLYAKIDKCEFGYGIWVKYQTFEGDDKLDLLKFSEYGGDGSSWEHCIAYECDNSGKP